MDDTQTNSRGIDIDIDDDDDDAAAGGGGGSDDDDHRDMRM